MSDDPKTKANEKKAKERIDMPSTETQADESSQHGILSTTKSIINGDKLSALTEGYHLGRRATSVIGKNTYEESKMVVKALSKLPAPKITKQGLTDFKEKLQAAKTIAKKPVNMMKDLKSYIDNKLPPEPKENVYRSLLKKEAEQKTKEPTATMPPPPSPLQKTPTEKENLQSIDPQKQKQHDFFEKAILAVDKNPNSMMILQQDMIKQKQLRADFKESLAYLVKHNKINESQKKAAASFYKGVARLSSTGKAR